MFGLRFKVFAGFAGLLVILGIVLLVGNHVLSRYSSATQRILSQNMTVADVRSTHHELYSMARTAQWTMHALAVAGAVVAVGFTFFVGRAILKPLRILTESAREIQEGRLDQSVPVRSNDELGKLSSAFNEMAVGLRHSKQQDAEMILRTQQATQLAIDSLPDGVVLINDKGTIELANNTAKRVLGIRSGEPIRDHEDLPLAAMHHGAMQTGQASHAAGYESAIRTADEGLEEYYLPRSIPILNDKREAIGSMIVLNDVTELHRLDEMKNSLLSMVAHELRTPLTTMRMIVHLVAERKIGPLTPKQQELLNAAADESDRLHHILDNLLDMNRIESGKVLMDMQSVPAASLVAGAVEGARGAFLERGIDLKCDLLDPLPCVRADATRVGHAFSNLLNNAMKYTFRGGTVLVSARASADFVEFIVADTGIGIPRQYLPRIFEKFFRVPGQEGDSGAGLGLAIVKDVVNAHGGRIVAESAEGKGSTFRFTLRR